MSISLNCVYDEQYDVIYYIPNFGSRIQVNMAYSRKGGLIKYHLLSQASTHPALHAVLPYTPSLGDFCSLFQSWSTINQIPEEASPSESPGREDNINEGIKCKRKFTVYRKLRRLIPLQHEIMSLEMAWGKVLDLDKTESFKFSLHPVASGGIVQRCDMVWYGWIWVSFWSHQVMCKADLK